MVRVKRAYVAATKEGGNRILVDRLWPRGVTKEKAQINHWAKEIAPSTDLRKWFHADPGRWAEFKRRYEEELKSSNAELQELADLAKDAPSLSCTAHAKSNTIMP